jgi:uncharacterized protein YbgA (DUF1722 family)/uncharacterized protein YbbK (DUF523 family)
MRGNQAMPDPDSGCDVEHVRPRLAVSSCLLGQAVRYDGRHKRHDWLVDTLGRYVEFMPLCPEVSIGLGIPRNPVQLTGDSEHPRVRTVNDPDRDVTSALQEQGRAVAATLDEVSGYLFKSRSPSCGLSHVAVLTESGEIVRSGRGVYARAVQEACQHLPVEEDNRLDDAALRENFVSRLYTYQRWLSLCAAGLSVQSLLDFHARHKYLLMAHSPDACRRLGRLLSTPQGVGLPALAREYLGGLMTALRQDGGSSRHFNVLQHILGYLRRRIAAPDRDELMTLLDAYRRDEVPLAVPVMCLRGHFHRCPDEYIDMQWYLWPYPDELGLRDIT